MLDIFDDAMSCDGRRGSASPPAQPSLSLFSAQLRDPLDEALGRQ